MSNNALPSILTDEEAASYLRLTVEELSNALESGQIPALKIAGKWRIKREVLEKLLESPSNPNKPSITAVFPDVAPKKPETAESESVRAQPPLPVSKEDAAGAPAARIVRLVPSSPQEPVSPAPFRGRVRGRVFMYNPKGGFGHARLPDNQLVWLDSNHFIERMPTPSPGDTVEFELHRSKRLGLEARAIRVIAQDDGQSESEAANTEAVAQDTSQRLVDASPPTVSPQSTDRVSKAAAPPAGTRKSRELYQKAALALAQGRYDDARRLFRQAIEAGADVEVYIAFFKMEKRGHREAARRIVEEAIARFRNRADLYVMYGQLERRARDYKAAEKIFREGLGRFPHDIQLKNGLAQTLVQVGTESSFSEAGKIFEWLERKGKLDKNSNLYHRFKAFQRSPRANHAYDFFRSAGARVGIAGRRDLPSHITDIVAEIHHPDLSESFGLEGAFLVRCFQRQPRPIEVHDLLGFLRGLRHHGVLGLQEGEVVINPSLAFLVVPNSDRVRDQVMSILSESNEAIVPLDDKVFESSGEPLKTLRDLLGQYLGLRDLYSSALPVSGRRFFGRERLLMQLTDEVERGQFLGIYGLRKIGKTSLIYQLRDEKLRGEAVAYADLQVLATRNCAELYWVLENDVYKRLRERDPEAASLLRLGRFEHFSDLPENGMRAGLLFAEDLRAFLDLLCESKIAGVHRLVMVLDELEWMLPIGGSPGIQGYLEFFGLLRGLAQTEQYRGLLSSVVVAANAAISERGYWEGRENPVFALYKPIFLPPLSEDECAKMIRDLGRGMSVYWDNEAIQAVFSETGGHPFLTRVFCSRITKQYLTRPLNVTADMVQEQITPFIRDEGDKLEQITELLRTHFPQEEVLLEQIAVGETLSEMPDEALRHLLSYRPSEKDFG